MYFLVGYDIPVGTKAVNPSKQLRRYAVRINKSQWLVNENNLMYVLSILSPIENAGANCYTFPLSKESHKEVERQLINSAISAFLELVRRMERVDKAPEKWMEEVQDIAAGYLKLGFYPVVLLVEEVKKTINNKGNIGLVKAAFDAIKKESYISAERFGKLLSLRCFKTIVENNAVMPVDIAIDKLLEAGEYEVVDILKAYIGE